MLYSRKTLTLAFVGLLAFLSFLLIRPFIGQLLFAVVLSYLFYPIYLKVKKKIHKEALSAFLVTLLITIIILGPLLFVVSTLLGEVFSGTDDNGECDSLFCGVTSLLTLPITTTEDRADVQRNLTEVLEDEALITPSTGSAIQLENVLLQDNIQRISLQLVAWLLDSLLKIPFFLLSLFIIFFTVYYLLKDGRKFYLFLADLLPATTEQKKEFIKRFNSVTHAVVFGQLAIAFIQAVLATIGFAVAGINSPLIWGVVVFIAAHIPLLGTAGVWIPLSLLLLLNGYLNNDVSVILKAVGLMVYSTFLVSSIDNVLKPRLISGRAKLHPLLILIGVLGGVQLFGIVGIVVGPVLFAIVEIVVSQFLRENNKSAGAGI